MKCNKYKKISIITPLYKGIHYLPELSQMIEICAKQAACIADIEWIISNDDPEMPINAPVIVSGVDVKIINTDINRGIQGARVTGLNASTGEFILFLDQDDYIAPEWITSQLNHIGESDAVVCSCIKSGKSFSDNYNKVLQKKYLTKEYNLTITSGFIPGQVLIKKDKIPSLWKNKWLHWNYCDDYYLWLCMFSKDCKFAMNEDALYEHRSGGTNQTLSTYAWYKSTLELIDIIREEKLFCGSELQSFLSARQKKIELSLMDKGWTNMKLEMYKGLLYFYENNKLLSDLIKAYGTSHYAIYGAAFGQRILERLKSEGSLPDCIIDRDAQQINMEIPVYTMEEIPNSINLVINTLVQDDNIVKRYIESHYKGVKVVHFRDILRMVQT